jgi:hypothetical protein
MSNFLDILCLSIFCSKDKDRQASKWGGSPYLPFASLSGRPQNKLAHVSEPLSVVVGLITMYVRQRL